MQTSHQGEEPGPPDQTSDRTTLGCGGDCRWTARDSPLRQAIGKREWAEIQARWAHSLHPACGNGNASARPDTAVSCYSSHPLIRANVDEWQLLTSYRCLVRVRWLEWAWFHLVKLSIS